MSRRATATIANIDPYSRPIYPGQFVSGFAQNAAPVAVTDAALIVIAGTTIVAPIPARFLIDVSAEVDAAAGVNQELTFAIRIGGVGGVVVDTVQVTLVASSKNLLSRCFRSAQLATGGHLIELVAQCDAGHTASVPAGGGSVRAVMQSGPF